MLLCHDRLIRGETFLAVRAELGTARIFLSVRSSPECPALKDKERAAIGSDLSGSLSAKPFAYG